MLVPSIFNDNFTDDLFDSFFSYPSFQTSAPAWRAKASTMMQTDVQDKGDSYELDVELPGFKKEDVTVELKDGYLTITAEHNENNDEKNSEGKYIRRERFTGHCSRRFFIGKNIQEEDIKARYENGILNLTFPKEEAKPKIENRKLISIE